MARSINSVVTGDVSGGATASRVTGASGDRVAGFSGDRATGRPGAFSTLIGALCGRANAAGALCVINSFVRFAWDANPAGDNVTGYKLYYGTSSGVYTASVSVGNVTAYSFAYVGPRYYALTAVNDIGESAFSDEVFHA